MLMLDGNLSKDLYETKL